MKDFLKVWGLRLILSESNQFVRIEKNRSDHSPRFEPHDWTASSCKTANTANILNPRWWRNQRWTLFGRRRRNNPFDPSPLVEQNAHNLANLIRCPIVWKWRYPIPRFRRSERPIVTFFLLSHALKWDSNWLNEESRIGKLTTYPLHPGSTELYWSSRFYGHARGEAWSPARSTLTVCNVEWWWRIALRSRTQRTRMSPPRQKEWEPVNGCRYRFFQPSNLDFQQASQPIS